MDSKMEDMRLWTYEGFESFKSIPHLQLNTKNLASCNALSMPNHGLTRCSLGVKANFVRAQKKCLVEFEQEIHIDHKQSIKLKLKLFFQQHFHLDNQPTFSWFVFREQQPISLLPHLSHSKQPPT
jgi:hypothetical protein